MTTKEVVVNEKKTTPPPLFTEATLLAALVRVADFVTDPVIKKLLKDKDRDKKTNMAVLVRQLRGLPYWKH